MAQGHGRTGRVASDHDRSHREPETHTLIRITTLIQLQNPHKNSITTCQEYRQFLPLPHTAISHLVDKGTTSAELAMCRSGVCSGNLKKKVTLFRHLQWATVLVSIVETHHDEHLQNFSALFAFTNRLVNTEKESV